jgi:hypothetical protein
MPVTVRFAPSPTGRLHAGNIRTALLNYLFARKHGGDLILRLDDTDRERSTVEFARGIEMDLAWLGLEWTKLVHQSNRSALYAAAVEKLKEAGRLYPAYETPEELALKRKRQLARGKPPIYDRAALALSAEDKAKLEAEGRAPHWRFRLEQRDVVWDDLVRGRQHVDAASLSDPVLIRADGTYLYTLPSVVDDIDLGITHVIRGEDHVANTAPQIQLFEALGTPPAFGHHNLLVGPDGHALSKRDRSLAIEGMRAEGLEPLAVTSYAATIGTSDRAAYKPRRIGGGLRVRQAVARAGAVRPARPSPLERKAPAHAALRHGGAASGKHGHLRRGSVLGGRARQSRGAGGRRDLVACGERAARSRHRGRCTLQCGGGAPAARALERGDMARVVVRREGSDRRQGQSPVSAAALGADRGGPRPRTQASLAADRP